MEIQKVLHLHLEEEKKKPNINHKYMVTEKLDGWYCYIDYTPTMGWSHVMSSSHRPIPSMKWCLGELFSKLPTPLIATRFIMEAIIPNTPFHIANGIFNRSVGDCAALDTIFYIHDMVPLYSYSSSSHTALGRYMRLQSYLGKDKDKIKLIPTLEISANKDDWMFCFEVVVANGGEGVILKQVDSLYQPGKRNSTLMKIKEEVTLDLLCVDAYKTIGEKGNENWNLKLKRKSGITLDVRLGKHSDIALLEEDRDNFVGKVIEVKAMKELPDGMLREPRFKAVRFDKTEGDID